MNRLLFKGIVFECLRRINKERTVFSIYYLLKGNRSIQTVQDAHLYDLDAFYGIHKKLTKQMFEEKVNDFITEGFLKETTNEKNQKIIYITQKAVNWLEVNNSVLYFQYFNGRHYHEIGEVFYQRLLLLIQTLTNTMMNNFSFIPVIERREVEQWVKQFYKVARGKEKEYLTKLQGELEQLLGILPTDYANIFVDRITGYRHFGKSIDQLSIDYQRSKSDIQLILVASIHALLTYTQEHKAAFPVLLDIIDQKSSLSLQHSTAQTYQLFKKNNKPEQIAAIRRLKMNTIYDHLVEIALNDSAFPFSDFINKEEQQAIIHAIEQSNSYKLKTIKEIVQPDISYFQIRLMLVWYHKKAHST